MESKVNPPTCTVQHDHFLPACIPWVVSLRKGVGLPAAPSIDSSKNKTSKLLAAETTDWTDKTDSSTPTSAGVAGGLVTVIDETLKHLGLELAKGITFGITYVEPADSKYLEKILQKFALVGMLSEELHALPRK